MKPLTYLEPFLEVIQSPETSGPITGVALTSVRRLLEDYTFGDTPSFRAKWVYANAMAQDITFVWSRNAEIRNHDTCNEAGSLTA